jgi:hypothetical protein
MGTRLAYLSIALLAYLLPACVPACLLGCLLGCLPACSCIARSASACRHPYLPPCHSCPAAALLEAKMKGADMQLDMEAVLAEDPGLAAALEAATQREAAAAAEGSEPLAPQQQQPAGGDSGGSEMAAAEVEGGQQQEQEEEEEGDGESAALRGLGAAPTQQGAAGGAAVRAYTVVGAGTLNLFSCLLFVVHPQMSN